MSHACPWYRLSSRDSKPNVLTSGIEITSALQGRAHAVTRREMAAVELLMFELQCPPSSQRHDFPSHTWNKLDQLGDVPCSPRTFFATTQSWRFGDSLLQRVATCKSSSLMPSSIIGGADSPEDLPSIPVIPVILSFRCVTCQLVLDLEAQNHWEKAKTMEV